MPPPVAHVAALNTSAESHPWKLPDLLPLAITAINGIGWLAVYFLVLAPQAEQSRVQARLLDEQLARLQSANQKIVDQLDIREKGGRVQLDDSNRRFIELQIARLEAATVRLEDQLANIRTRTQATTDFNAVRQSLRPNIIFGKFDFKFPHPDKVELEHNIRNIGANAVIVAAPNLRLSLKPIDNNSRREDLLIAGEDFNVKLYRPGMLQPGVSNSIDYTIEMLSARFRGFTLYYSLDWKTSTDSAAVSSAQKILGGNISASELSALSTFTQTLSGTITFSR